MNLQTLINLFTQSREYQRLSAKSKTEYQRYYIHTPRYLLNVETQYLTTPDFFHFLDSIEQDAKSNRCKAALQKVFSWGYQRGYVERNLIQGITKRREYPRSRYITDSEYMMLYAYAKTPCKIAMELAYLGIMRIKEVVAIKLDDIHPEGLLTTNCKSHIKQYKEYTVRLTAAIERGKLLYAGPHPRTHLICKSDGTAYSIRAIQDQYDKAKQRSGITDVTFHDLKAKGYSDFEGNRVEKQLAAGHKSINMGQVYDRRIQIVKPTR